MLRKKELIAWLEEAFITLKEETNRLIEIATVDQTDEIKKLKEIKIKANQAKEEIISIITKS